MSLVDNNEQCLDNEATPDQSDECQVNGKQAARGRAAMLLLSSSEDEDDNDDTNDKAVFASTKGIYGRKINQTQNELKAVQNKFHEVEKDLMTKIKNDTLNTRNKSNDSSSSLNDSSDSVSQENKFKFTKRSLNDEKVPEDEDDDDGSLSPPSPPPQLLMNQRKTKRKSTSVVEREIKELEKMNSKVLYNGPADFTNNISMNNCEDEARIVTVRISTKLGIQKFEIEENEPFQTIFEKLAKQSNKTSDCFILSLRDKIIRFDDTPKTIQLKTFDIIDCVQNKKKALERIQIVENDEKLDEMTNGNANMLVITLQTHEGRKSRVKFLLFKDEPFEKVLKMYCDKREFGDYQDYMLEFDGDRVDLAETPEDLDLDGEEIFDIKKSQSKTTLEHVESNKKNYEFDDDILCV